MSILINLEHTVEEANLILAALADRPFKEVADLIAKIQAKGKSALEASQLTAKPSDDSATEADAS
jgi:hypothetical protein